MATSRSPASFVDHHDHGLSYHGDEDGHSDDEDMELLDPDSVPVEVLVEHLLAAKRALSSVTLVQRANALSTHARQLYEESVILDAQTAFLKRGIVDQRKLLERVLRSMVQTYDGSKKEFTKLTKDHMDKMGQEIEQTMDKLKKIPVDPVFRPPGEEPKFLFDFVSEDQVPRMFADLMDGVHQLLACQDTFHKEIKHLNTEMQELTHMLSPVSISQTTLPTGPNEASNASMMELFASMRDQTHLMAENLQSLMAHFDACAAAVRTTEGGADLARRKAAEDSSDTNAVSISGVMPPQGVDFDEPETRSRAEAVTRVMHDAYQVDEVVAELHTELQQVELDYSFLKDQSDRTKAAYEAVIQAFRHLEGIGSRLEGYIEASNSFVDHWNEEREAIFHILRDMELLQVHWENYARSYDTLILEVERRRVVEERIHNIWRKAKAEVDKLVESDWAAREDFTADVGEYVPHDLWVGMSGPLQKWEVVRAQNEEGVASAPGKAASREMPKQEEGSAATLDRDVVDGAFERILKNRK